MIAQSRGAALAERLGLTIIGREGHDVKTACPCCDSSDGFRVHSETGVAFCFVCQEKFSRLKLATKILGDEQAAWKLLEEIGLEQPRHVGNGYANGSAPMDVLAIVARQKSVTPEALAAFGGEAQRGAVVFPMFGPDGQQCSTFTLKPDGGKGLYEKGKPSGLFFPHDEAGNVRLPKPGEKWHIVEGPKDAAALHSLGLLACGLPSCAMVAKFAALFAGVHCVMVPDLDTPGKDGAAKSASRLYARAASVYIARLPGEFRDTKGPDVRDALKQPGGREAVLQALACAIEWQPLANAPTEADGKTSTVTNAEVRDVADPETGEPKKAVAPLPIAEVLLRIHAATENWPRRIGSALFTHDAAGLAWLPNEAALFGWLGHRTGIIHWYRVVGCSSRGEVFAELQRTAERYEAIEELPHHPPIGRHYYACQTPTPGDGSAIRGLIERFTPATPIDGDLMLAALLTILWGGSCGSRPAFVFTADAGRGKGKSKAAELLSRVAGGTIDFSANEDMGQIKTRLLSPDALPKRVALLDNVKSHRFSWAELEALITAPAISGRRMYVGEGTRPNTLTWIVTLNGAALSTDMAQRSIIVKIGEPNRSRSWEDDTTAYIEANRQAIIADAIGILSGPPQAELARYSRWATWEAGVLSRLPDPSEAQAVILERQGAVDVEAEEADAIGEFFKQQLERLDYSTDREVVLIPSSVASRWLNWATGEQRSVIAGCRTIKQLCEERRLVRLAASAGRGNGRGFVWSGELADVEERMKTDVAERLAAKDRRNG